MNDLLKKSREKSEDKCMIFSRKKDEENIIKNEEQIEIMYNNLMNAEIAPQQ